MVRAGVFSTGIHLALAFGVSWVMATRGPGAARPSVVEQVADVVADDKTVEVSAADFAQAPDEPADPEPDSPSETDLSLPAADDATRTAVPRAPRFGLVAQAAAPAPDSGKGTGALLPASWRRDTSTLRARLTDGAAVYQPSHEKTSIRASSAQALRREPVVGEGDSTRTQLARPAEERVPRPALPESSDEAREQQSLLARLATPVSTGDGVTRGEGPLDATRGRKSFDVDREGPVRDTEALRAASNEAHPGLVDLAKSAAQAQQAGLASKGPAAAPGAVNHPAQGAAPAVAGAAQALPLGDQTAANEAARQYLRYELDIRRRVDQALQFPRKLALMLEQGESIVRFTVKADGRLAGDVQLVKSAGFDEFDQEALRAVIRAAPFPPSGRVLTVSLRLAFQSPTIR